MSQFSAALFSASQENTAALVQAKFDFSIWKTEAPSEYQPVKKALTKHRATAAESGTPHRTASRLGALFESKLPRTPNLIKAYGARASEISQALSTKPKDSHGLGAFDAWAGVDGTSIWAAATSGASPIAVHLLACMLILWPADQATSIWVELVAERRRELRGTDEDSIPLHHAALLSHDVTETHLSEWDSSARAWMRAASTVPFIKEKQRRLKEAMDGIKDEPFNHHADVYASVINAWVTSLETLERVVAGASYSVQTPAVLHALSSWHLYPDIVVLGEQTKEIAMNDHLIGLGGNVIIGLETSTASPKGVHWTLSLAHLRYYGPAVSRSVLANPERWSFEQFGFVLLGSLLGNWQVAREEIEPALEFLHVISDHCKDFAGLLGFPSRLKSWAQVFGDLAWEALMRRNDAAKECRQLIKHGMRRPQMMGNVRQPGFDLLHPRVIYLVKDIPTKIDLFRKIIGNTGDRGDVWLIRILSDSNSTSSMVSTQDEVAVFAFPGFEASPTQTPAWVWLSKGSAEVKYRNILPTARHFTLEDSMWALRKGLFDLFDPPGQFFRDGIPEQSLEDGTAARTQAKPGGFFKSRVNFPTPKRMRYTFECVLGVETGVGVFRRIDFPNERSSASVADVSDSKIHRVDLQTSLRILSQFEIDREALSLHLAKSSTTALRAVAKAALIYESLPHATISPRIADNKLALDEYKWANAKRSQDPASAARLIDEFKDLTPLNITLEDAFACVVSLESGGWNLDPAALSKVMAISSEDSLYIAAPLLCDPSTALEPYQLRRVMGNIGRAGLALLIPHQEPTVKDATSQDWRLVNHHPFDGKLENSFATTSLQLSFTGYERPLPVTENHGGRFVEVFFIETVLSVYDRSKKIADVDVLAALASPRFFPLAQQPHCERRPAGQKPPFDVIAIDNWEELLECPEAAVVVRAHGNWQARLAATAICTTLHHRTVLFQDHGCWSCGENLYKALKRLPIGGETKGSQVGTVVDWSASDASPAKQFTNLAVFIM